MDVLLFQWDIYGFYMLLFCAISANEVALESVTKQKVTDSRNNLFPLGRRTFFVPQTDGKEKLLQAQYS